MTLPHMLPSTLLTGSASATLELSRLNVLPHEIVVYASRTPSPAHAQHSLPGARYGLPAPVFHRLDHASFPGAQAISLSGAQRLLRFARCNDSVVAATRASSMVAAYSVQICHLQRIPQQ